MAKRGPATPEKVFRHLANARRELVKAVERAGRLEDQGLELRPGHIAEARRRVQAVREELNRAVETFKEREGGG